MGNVKKQIAAKTAWAKVGEERARYKTALLYIHRVAQKALDNKKPENYKLAMETIEAMALTALPPDDIDRFKP